jgi:hypothetical protein
MVPAEGTLLRRGKKPQHLQEPLVGLGVVLLSVERLCLLVKAPQLLEGCPIGILASQGAWEKEDGTKEGKEDLLHEFT